MSFLRPEAVDVLRRYGEPVLYGAIAIALIREGIVAVRGGSWIGVVVIAAGCVPALAAIGRIERALIARRIQRQAPGVVGIEEGRITYFGPHGGGVIAIDLLLRVAIRTTSHGPAVDDSFWELTDETGVTLAIPTGAANATDLLDILDVLPNFNTRAVVQAMGSTDDAIFEIWQRPGGYSAPSISS